MIYIGASIGYCLWPFCFCYGFLMPAAVERVRVVEYGWYVRQR